MKVPCPVCGAPAEFSRDNPWRPFCSERCKLIDLGEWGNDDYRIAGEPGSADRMTPEALEDAALHAAELAARREESERRGARRR